MKIKAAEYTQIDEDNFIEGRPIVAGPVFHTYGISEILHFIVGHSFSLIPQIVPP